MTRERSAGGPISRDESCGRSYTHDGSTLSTQPSAKLLPPVSVPRRPPTKPPIVHRTPTPLLVPVLVSSSNCGVAPVASVPMSIPAPRIPRMPSPALPVMIQAAISAWAFLSTMTPWLPLFRIVFEKICDDDPLYTWIPCAPLF